MKATSVLDPQSRLIRQARSQPSEDAVQSVPTSAADRLPAPPTELLGPPNQPTARALHHANMLQMQQTMGNRAVQRLLKTGSGSSVARVIQRAPIQRGLFDDAVDWASDTAGDIEDWVGETADDAGDWMKETAEDASELMQPWIQEFTSASGTPPIALSSEGKAQNVDSGWVKDPVGTGILSVDTGLAATVAGMYIPGSKLVQYYLSQLVGAAVGFWSSYEGYEVQRRITGGGIIPVHEWYGTYRMNVINGDIVSVDFAGRGPTFLTGTKLRLHERLTDGKGKVLYTHPASDLPMTGYDATNVHNLPEFSFDTKSYGADQPGDYPLPSGNERPA